MLREICRSPAVASFSVMASIPEVGASSALGAARRWALPDERASVVPSETPAVRYVVVGLSPSSPRVVFTVLRSAQGWLIERTTACLEASSGPRTCRDELFFDGRAYVAESRPRGAGSGVGRSVGQAGLVLCRATDSGAVKSRGPVAPVRVYAANEQPYSYALVVSEPDAAPRVFISDGARLVPADSRVPSAGVCARSVGSTVIIVINPDTSAPRCTFVRPDQQLKIVNASDSFGQPGQPIAVTLPGGLQRRIRVGGSILIDRPFGAYLAPGVHRMRISLYDGGGPELWLRAPSASELEVSSASPGGEAIRISVNSHCGVLSVWVGKMLWLADPPLGDHNPPDGWDENITTGYFITLGPGRAVFEGDAGQKAHFRQAPPGIKDPAAGCE